VAFPLQSQNNQILCGQALSLRPANLPISLMVIYAAGQTALNASIIRNDNVANHSGVMVFQTSTGFWLTIGDNTGAVAVSRRSLQGSIAPVIGKWQVIIAVIRGATDMALFVNGLKDPSTTYDGTGGAMAYGTGQMSIGGNISTNVFCQGTVAAAMLWPLGLTDEMAMAISADSFAAWRPSRSWWYAAGGAGYTVALADSMAFGDPDTHSDKLAVVAAYNIGIADDLTAADALSVLAAYGVSLADTFTAADTEAAVAAFLTSLADDATLADALTAAFAGAVSIADTLEAGDSIELQAAYQASLQGTLTAADTIAAIGAYLATLTDSVTASDVLALVQAHAAVLADSLMLSDAITAVTAGEGTYTIALQDTLSLADALWLMLPVALTFLLGAIGRRFDTAETGRRFDGETVGRRFITAED
jgi:hypothetical protein